MISSVCVVCGCADEYTIYSVGGYPAHRDCYFRTEGAWYLKAYQKIIDFFWWSKWKLVG